MRSQPSGQMRDQKLHAVVARSAFPSQKCSKLTILENFWKFRCQKSARRCGEAHFEVNMLQNTACSDPFWTFNRTTLSATTTRTTAITTILYHQTTINRFGFLPVSENNGNSARFGPFLPDLFFFCHVLFPSLLPHITSNYPTFSNSCR